MAKALGLLWIVICLAIVGVAVSQNEDDGTYSFEIDYENNQFLLDGKPFRYVAGSFHYFRAPHQRWRDILRKMRAAGLNAVSTYVEWSMHEPQPDQWVWEGDADLARFIKIAEEEDLLVILRPGPYICAERDFGGFPYWLLSLVPDIKLRTNDERYMYYANRFLNKMFEQVKPLLRGNGGPIIMVQVENEYGSFYACNEEYKESLYNLFNDHVENKALLFSTDGPSRSMLKCGHVPNVYSTIDFGSGANVKANFAVMKLFSGRGPLVNSEFYPGWLTHWSEKFQRIGTDAIVKTLEEMLNLNASVNFYMFYGGTNFGFTSGANINANYWPQLTSYDYDAPLDEAGDPTPKYFKIRESIAKYLPLPNLKEPTVAPKGNYGPVSMTPVIDMFTKEFQAAFGACKEQHKEPPTFESLSEHVHFVAYEADFPQLRDTSSITLKVKKVSDRALVYVDEKLVGKLSRMDKSYSASLPNVGKRIKLLVEDLGHVNFGSIDVEDFKGIWNVSINDQAVGPWEVQGYPLSSVNYDDFNAVNTLAEVGDLTYGPQSLLGAFNVEGEPLDSYLNTAGWGKGIAFVNGYNLGRYWPAVGPQLTLYVPKEYLKKGENSLSLVELERVPSDRVIKFQTTPILDYPRKAILSV